MNKIITIGIDLAKNVFQLHIPIANENAKFAAIN